MAWYQLPTGKVTYQELKRQLPKCRLCADLYDIEPRPFFWGNQKVRIFQISQSPSYNVHLSGKPFDDQSGQRLRQWYDISPEIFYDQNNFYMSSIAHCYPGKDAKGRNRKPPEICAQIWLKRELDVVEASLYIVIGAYAARYFFPGLRFDDLVFSDILEIRGKPAIVLPHPSPLNKYWLERFPRFETERIPQIRQKVHEALGISN